MESQNSITLLASNFYLSAFTSPATFWLIGCQRHGRCETDGEIRKVNSEEEYPSVTCGSHKNESKCVTLEKTETENYELKREERK